MERSKRKKKKKSKLKPLKVFFAFLISIVIIASFATGGVVLAMIKTAPALDVNEILSLNEPSRLYATADGKDVYMDDVITDERRVVVSIKDIPENLQNATVAIEDERFFKHKGIDPRRILGSLYIDVLNKINHKSELQGGSTITQQLLKKTLLTSDQKISRKVQEAYLAIKLETMLTKNQILEAYLNTIPYGGNSYGVEAAAEQYFSKNVKDLNLLECAFLAGMPQSPSVRYPFSSAAKKDPSIYMNRTKTVLYKMYENGYITKAQYDKTVNEKLNFKPSFASTSKLMYEWFSGPAINQVKNDLKSQYQYDDKEINALIMNGGLKIYTTMDKKLQDNAQKIMDNYNFGSEASIVKGIKQPQSSAVVMDYHTGEVKVIIGGIGTQPAWSYNRAASTKFLRPSGSSIKPLSVYSAAIDSQQATAGTVIEDSPLPEEIGKQYPQPDGSPYNPKNYDSEGFSGYVTIREAIAKSINLVAIKLENQIGLKTGASYAEKFGLTLDKEDKTSLAALSLGQLHHGTNTLTMASAYGVFGNNGMYTAPKLYTKVVDRNGRVLLESKYTTRKVLSPQSAYIMYDLLKGPVQYGTATNAQLGNMPAAGKTGTSSDKQDFWFCGLTPYYSGSIWIGNDTPKKYYNIGSYSAADIWGKIMKEAVKNLPVKDLEMPSGLVTATVCKDSGKLPTDLCAKDPRGNRTYSEIFTENTVPTELCDIHVEASINKINGKLATEYTPANLIEKKVFIKKENPSAMQLGDSAYALPTEADDTKPVKKEDEQTGNDQGTKQTEEDDSGVKGFINNIIDKFKGTGDSKNKTTPKDTTDTSTDGNTQR